MNTTSLCSRKVNSVTCCVHEEQTCMGSSSRRFRLAAHLEPCLHGRQAFVVMQLFCKQRNRVQILGLPPPPGVNTGSHPSDDVGRKIHDRRLKLWRATQASRSGARRDGTPQRDFVSLKKCALLCRVNRGWLGGCLAARRTAVWFVSTVLHHRHHTGHHLLCGVG